MGINGKILQDDRTLAEQGIFGEADLHDEDLLKDTFQTFMSEGKPHAALRRQGYQHVDPEEVSVGEELARVQERKMWPKQAEQTERRLREQDAVIARLEEPRPIRTKSGKLIAKDKRPLAHMPKVPQLSAATDKKLERLPMPDPYILQDWRSQLEDFSAKKVGTPVRNQQRQCRICRCAYGTSRCRQKRSHPHHLNVKEPSTHTTIRRRGMSEA